MDGQVDLRYVRDNLGHASISTTSQCLHADDDDRHRATESGLKLNGKGRTHRCGSRSATALHRGNSVARFGHSPAIRASRQLANLNARLQRNRVGAYDPNPDHIERIVQTTDHARHWWTASLSRVRSFVLPRAHDTRRVTAAVPPRLSRPPPMAARPSHCFSTLWGLVRGGPPPGHQRP